MSSPIILTRYLYIYDEVKYSLQESILKGESFEECVFWCGELYYSGYAEQLWELIFEFYYNFCAVSHPKYERKLSKIYAEHEKKNNITKILAAITLLFYTKKNYDVFTLWQVSPKIPNKVYLGRLPKWYHKMNVDAKYKNFARSIHAQNWHNIVFYVNYFSPEETYKLVKTYFRTVHGMVLRDKKVSEIPYSNKKHIVFTLVKYLFTDEKEIQKRAIFRSYNHNEFKANLEESQKTITPAYKTLPERLSYPICNTIGCFPLTRYSLTEEELKELYWYHWEYCCYECPLWKERFDKYDIEINHEKKKITFKDDDEYERFCEQYYYENDEQSREVQERNIGTIPKISLGTWLEPRK